MISYNTHEKLCTSNTNNEIRNKYGHFTNNFKVYKQNVRKLILQLIYTEDQLLERSFSPRDSIAMSEETPEVQAYNVNRKVVSLI